MELINKKDNQIIFTAKVEESIANAIRRFVNEIPIMAIDEIEIFRNDSPLYDETISHRMGLIPLKMNKSIPKTGRVTYWMKDEFKDVNIDWMLHLSFIEKIYAIVPDEVCPGYIYVIFWMKGFNQLRKEVK